MWQFQQRNTTPVGGVLINELNTDYYGSLTNHVDLPSLLPFANRNASLTNLGIRDIYALSTRPDVPFMLPNIENGTFTYIEGDEYTFETPTESQSVTTLISVDEDDETELGAGGQPFKITLSNGNLGGYGARFSLSLMLPYVVEVVDFQRKGVDGGHVQYTVVYYGNYRGEDSIPSTMFQPGNPIYKLAGTRSKEFGQKFDSWGVQGGVNKKYVSRITNAQVQTHYHMTSEACNFADGALVKDKEWILKNLYKVVEMVGLTGKVDPSIRTVNDFVSSFPDEKYGVQSLGSRIGFKVLSTLYDNISIGILQKEIGNVMVWDPGGQTGSDGLDSQYIHPGIWHQFDYSGFKHEFNVNTLTKDTVLAAIRAFRANRKVKPDYGQEDVYEIITGEAGEMWLMELFKAEILANQTGLVMAKEIGSITGDYKTGLSGRTPWYKEFTWSGNLTIRIKKDPSLDPTGQYIDDFNNPVVKGFRLSSWTMIIQAADMSASNIKIVRNRMRGDEYGGNLKMWVNPGTFTHPLLQLTNTQTSTAVPMHLSTSNQTGFSAYFTAVPDTAVVWDSTNFLKLSPINPLTGRSSGF